jgi:hypothetical protein
LPPPFVCGHLREKLEELLQPLRVVAETSADIDALKYFVVPFMRVAQIGGDVVRVIEVSNGRRKMCLAHEQDFLGAAGQVGLILVG